MKGLAGLSLVVAAFAAPVSARASESQAPGLADSSPAGPAFLVEAVAEKVLNELPPGPLYWRVEAFPTLAEAQASAGPFSLPAEAWGAAWLFTLGAPDGVAAGGRKLVEVGPIPVPSASKYLLRINRAGGPPGVSTPVHTHAGSEAFYVLKGQLSQKTPHGIARVEAGHSMNGHHPGMAMQLTSTGSGELEQLVMFVVDADKPFSSPATFE